MGSELKWFFCNCKIVIFVYHLATLTLWLYVNVYWKPPIDFSHSPKLGEPSITALRQFQVKTQHTSFKINRLATILNLKINKRHRTLSWILTVVAVFFRLPIRSHERISYHLSTWKNHITFNTMNPNWRE